MQSTTTPGTTNPGAMPAEDPTIGVRFEQTWAGSPKGEIFLADAVSRLDTDTAELVKRVHIDNAVSFHAAAQRYARKYSPHPRFLPVGVLALQQNGSLSDAAHFAELCRQIGVETNVRLASLNSNDHNLLLTVHKCAKWGERYLMVVRSARVKPTANEAGDDPRPARRLAMIVVRIV